LRIVLCVHGHRASGVFGRSAACWPSRCHVFVTMWLACSGVRSCSFATRLLDLVGPVIIFVQSRDSTAEWQYLRGVVGEPCVLEACCSAVQTPPVQTFRVSLPAGGRIVSRRAFFVAKSGLRSVRTNRTGPKVRSPKKAVIPEEGVLSLPEEFGKAAQKEPKRFSPMHGCHHPCLVYIGNKPRRTPGALEARRSKKARTEGGASSSGAAGRI